MRIELIAKMLARMLIQPAREPDLIVGDRYMLRWFLLPRNSWLNVYLHHFLHSDDDRALHDHPYWSVSICLRGRSVEHLQDRIRLVERGCVVFRSAPTPHRMPIRLTHTPTRT